MYTEQMRAFQWLKDTFSSEVVFSPRERALRLIEEAIEFGQAVGVTPADVDALNDQVFSKPVGDVEQEIAGVGVCALVAAEALRFDLQKVVLDELRRVEQPKVQARIREKHLVKVR